MRLETLTRGELGKELLDYLKVYSALHRRASTMKTVVFDHLNLNDASRTLISKAIDPSQHVFLAALDKGLSGSSVWLARWPVHPSIQSKYHVFKIGPASKLTREHDAIVKIVSRIEKGFPNVEFIQSENDELDLALLLQEFVGTSDGAVRNLKSYFARAKPSEAEGVINKLYSERLHAWHYEVKSAQHNHDEGTPPSTYAEALDWWVSRANINEAAESVGKSSIEKLLGEKFGFSIDSLQHELGRLASLADTFPMGPVHGDLHAQNILLDSYDQIQVIDYGWTSFRWRAIDFLMLECSLKFLVAPNYVDINDLLLLDDVVEAGSMIDFVRLNECRYGERLESIARAVRAIRHHALTSGASSTILQYRRGLAMLMNGLTSLPGDVNKAYLLCSLARTMNQVRCDEEN